jgi:hypothetical protein
MSLPPRIGAALVVLGENNGQSERTPGHLLSPAYYGGGIHEYFTNYPVTTPSNVITKAWGLLGATVGPDVTVTPSTLPKNTLVIVCYKTELNHYFPDAAKDGLYNIPTLDTTTALYSTGSGTALNTGTQPGTTEQDLVNAWNSTFNATVSASFAAHTDVTDLLATPLPVPGLHEPGYIFPRWTDEDAYDRFGYEIGEAFLITPATGSPYYQTRTGLSNTPKAGQQPLDYITPWFVASSGGTLYSELRIQCDFSYKFTNAGGYTPSDFVRHTIVNPWYDYYVTSANGRMTFLADEASWQYSQDDYGNTAFPYPAGAYRTGDQSGVPYYMAAVINPAPSYVNYESKATHGLFLDADGSCWNLGTTLKVRVHIWKAPPKYCFWPNNETTTAYNGDSYSYTNWQVGLPSGGAGTYFYQPTLGSVVNLPGPIKGRGTISDPFLGWETGVPTQIGYTLPVPKPVDAHYWGCVFAPDYDSEECEEHDIMDFTVVIDETNTYECDGAERDGVEYTAYGVKLEDIELPTIEGFITYIKDFEVYEITKPGEV